MLDLSFFRIMGENPLWFRYSRYASTPTNSYSAAAGTQSARILSLPKSERTLVSLVICHPFIETQGMAIWCGLPQFLPHPNLPQFREGTVTERSIWPAYQVDSDVRQ